jgi:hypothetical protein
MKEEDEEEDEEEEEEERGERRGPYLKMSSIFFGSSRFMCMRILYMDWFGEILFSTISEISPRTLSSWKRSAHTEIIAE